MIDVKDLTFSYGKDNQALHGLNFIVNKGEIFGFLGQTVLANQQRKKS